VAANVLSKLVIYHFIGKMGTTESCFWTFEAYVKGNKWIVFQVVRPSIHSTIHLIQHRRMSQQIKETGNVNI